MAVLRDGAVLEQRVWGWADAARRLPFTARTAFPICSITKQFTCALALDLFGDPAVLDPAIAAAMPLLATPPPALRLCHNQSGLRDYWATAMLCGAPAEGVFTAEDAATLFGRTRSLQFAPGTRFSYSNGNFRLLSDAIQARAGRGFGELLRERIFARAGMDGAALTPCPDAIPGGTLGYEGSAATGFRPAVNRIHWTGDAGLTATLDDMVAWERFIDAGRDEADGLYNRLAGPVAFTDGSPAVYGFGLRRSTVLGRAATGHGGGLRGWRSARMVLPAERLSVVVLFNHGGLPQEAATALLRAVLDEPAPTIPTLPSDGWAGEFLEPETGLLARVEPAGPGRVRLRYGQGPELLDLVEPDLAQSPGVSLRRHHGTWQMDRGTDNQSSQLLPVEGEARPDIGGTFRSEELGAALTVTESGGVPYGAFSGFLGHGEMLALVPAGPDLWRLPCPRALDYAPPGDWTLAFARDAAGQVTSVQVGCWLARRVAFTHGDPG